MRYSKILLAIVLISILVFGSTMSAFAGGFTYKLTVFVAEESTGMGTVTVEYFDDGFEKEVNGIVEIDYEDDVKVTANPNPGFRFVNWMVCFNGAGFNNPGYGSTFTCNLSKCDVGYVPKVALKAYFEPIPANSTVKVHYINDDTDVRLIPEIIISGIIGEPYTTDEKIFPGFTLFKTTPNTTGIFGLEQAHVDYFYKPVVITDPPVSYTVTGAVSPVASGTISGTAAYPMGSVVKLTAMPSTHFTFDKWEIPAFVTPISSLNNVELTFNMPNQNFEAKAIFKEILTVTATIKYLNASDQPIKDPTQQVLPLGAYTLTPPAIPGYTFGVSSLNASGTITAQSVNFEVIHKYYVPVVVTNTVTNTVTDTVFVTAPATAPATTEVITTEAVPLGAAGPLNFDEFVQDETLPVTEMVTDGEEVMEEEVPLADALPQTGQLSAEMFYGIGGLVSGLGLWLKRRK